MTLTLIQGLRDAKKQNLLASYVATFEWSWIAFGMLLSLDLFVVE